MKKFLFAIVAVLIPLVNQAKTEVPASLKVMSYNIRNSHAQDGSNSWMFRAPASGVMLDTQRPDIFGLQEAKYDQVKFLEQGLEDYKNVGVGRDDGKKEGEHMSIFYNTKKIALLKWGTFWLSETPDEPSKGWDAACRRTATWAIMKEKKSGKKFLFINTHIDHRGELAQKNGIALIVEKAKELNKEDLPVVITGDFNVLPDNPCLDSIKEYAKNAREMAAKSDNEDSFNGWGRASEQIDYIWYRGFSSCSEFETHKKPYLDRTFISDHFPVIATLFF